jgi:hypothetical protein
MSFVMWPGSIYKQIAVFIPTKGARPPFSAKKLANLRSSPDALRYMISSISLPAVL